MPRIVLAKLPARTASSALKVPPDSKLGVIKAVAAAVDTDTAVEKLLKMSVRVVDVDLRPAVRKPYSGRQRAGDQPERLPIRAPSMKLD